MSFSFEKLGRFHRYPVMLICPTKYQDDRGWFMETWNYDEFRSMGLNFSIVQSNTSRSARNVLRGLHYQYPLWQGKLVRCVSGRILDVAVDVREDSPTFGQWVSMELSAQNRKMLWIPAGYAHGFYVRSESAEVNYLCDTHYCPEMSRIVRWDSHAFNIKWDIPGSGRPILSQSDDEALGVCAY